MQIKPSILCEPKAMLALVAQEGVISLVLFRLPVNDIPMPSCHTELFQYADDSAVVVTFKQPTLMVRYLETYVDELEIWL